MGLAPERVHATLSGNPIDNKAIYDDSSLKAAENCSF